MNKLADIGIALNFSPVIDRYRDIIAYDATLSFEDSILLQYRLSSRLDEVKDDLDAYYYKSLAVESYSGKAPLILSTSEWLYRGSASAPRPLFYEITVVYQSIWISLYYYEPTRLISSKERPTRKIGQGLQALPLLMQTAKPRFIFLSRRFPYRQNQAEIVAVLTRVLEYLREMGIEFIAAGASTRELTWFPDSKALPMNSSESSDRTAHPSPSRLGVLQNHHLRKFQENTSVV